MEDLLGMEFATAHKEPHFSIAERSLYELPIDRSVRVFTEEERITKTQALWRGKFQRRQFRSLVKMMVERNNIVKEILASEERYVNYLAILKEKYLTPMLKAVKGRLILRMEDIRTVFCDFDKNIMPVNQMLIDMLKRRVENWSIRSKLGDIFLQIAPFFKQYFQYLFNYKIAIEKLQEVQSLNLLHLEEFLYQRRQDPACFGLDLQSLLIKPAQRLMQYPLLLETLVKNTWPSHCDLEDLTEALKLVKQVASQVENQCTEADRISRVVDIQTSLVGLPADAEIVQPHRRFFNEGKFTAVNETGKIQQSLHCFLFNDLFVYATPLPDLFGRPQFTYVNRFDAGQCEVFQPQDVPIANALAIESTATPHLLILDMETSAKQLEWLVQIDEMSRYSELIRRTISHVAIGSRYTIPMGSLQPLKIEQYRRPVLRAALSSPASAEDLSALVPETDMSRVLPPAAAAAESSAADELKLQQTFNLPATERLVDSFGCFGGRLYLFTSRAIYHTSTIVTIPFDEMTRLKQIRAISFVPIENSIMMETKTSTRTLHGFVNSGACFEQIKSLVKAYGDNCKFD
eukprot:TRINITY_DN9125_c0_g1_i1.p1 TRINITY_DN9125_c0_g1~~TRINITY_DN9125_c0_g1_i1.p1  ORF type:complete len:615 (-),score=189.01 TRINITY_DN9125_c0_g1_i1:1205-2926(-)